ncbi:WYL domain-containing protein [Humibacter soli]
MLRLLELLESAGSRTLRELSDDLDVDERTVRRYIDQLRELEIPVESLRGRYGGYRLAAGFRMPPLMLSSDEALAVVLGLLRAHSSPGAHPTAVQTAMSKVRRALPAETARKLDTLLHATAFDEGDPGAIPDADVLLTVADAVAHHHPLAVRYGSQHGVATPRTLHPKDLISSAGRWYLTADDIDAEAERTFRVDRIRSARRLPGVLAPVARSGAAETVRALVDGFARSERVWRVVLRAQIDEAALRARLPASVAVIEPFAIPGAEQQWHRVEIHADRLDWLPSVIVSLGCPVLVDGPAELRTLLSDVAARLSVAASIGES